MNFLILLILKFWQRYNIFFDLCKIKSKYMYLYHFFIYFVELITINWKNQCI
jgi:hypothetical protein